MKDVCIKLLEEKKKRFEDDDILYRLVPRIQYKNSYDYGLGSDTYVLKCPFCLYSAPISRLNVT